MFRDMASTDSALDADQIALARDLLRPPVQTEQIWPALGAAAFAAIAALLLATAMIMAPPVTTSHLSAAER